MARGTVLVTGTSTGIGRATAAELAARGQALLRAALPDRALDRVIGRLSGLG
jgi:NAD(P)-dependent dehydrogenase (short-subunit alcohol dehydrogenase family)